MKRFLVPLVIALASATTGATMAVALLRDRLLEASDLVVIAQAGRTRAAAPNLIEKAPRTSLETTFRIDSVLKGTRPNRLIVRHGELQAQAASGASTATAGLRFTEQELYLLYLARGSDGIYQPTVNASKPGQAIYQLVPHE